MLFSSIFFIFIFLPIFLLLFFLFPEKNKNAVLLIGSLGFYFWGEPSFCLLALASAIFDYYLGGQIYNSVAQSYRARFFLGIGIASNLIILIYFKYTNFFFDTILHFFPNNQANFALWQIILPIGVSFIVFEKITYLVDIYRGISKPAQSIFNYLIYVFLFAKLLAGPIIKYHEIEKQLHLRVLSSDHVAEGFKRFLFGLFKKVIFADSCAEVTNQIFNLPSNDLSFTYAWLGILCFTLQIYFDFSAYSDMALGLARMLGFELKENFNMPYIATSFTDFWHRWHISLSTWIREYLYIPLGGNRVNQFRKFLNLWICFLLSGLWHGANWTFVLWGAYNGLFLILDKLFWLKISAYLPRFFRVGLTLLFVMIGWVIFRSSDFQQIHNFLITMITPSKSSAAYLDITIDNIVLMGIGFFLVLMPLMPIYTRLTNYYNLWQWRVTTEGVLFSFLGLLAISKVVSSSYTPFLYFKF